MATHAAYPADSHARILSDPCALLALTATPSSLQTVKALRCTLEPLAVATVTHTHTTGATHTRTMDTTPTAMVRALLVCMYADMRLICHHV